MKAERDPKTGKWMIQYRYKDWTLRTINNNLSAIFNFAVRYYDLSSNPCTKAGCIGKNHADEMQIWTKEEFQRFSDCLMDKRLSWLSFQILFWTGMRIGELLALTFEDVDLTARTITINKSYQRLHGKDIITPPKTPKSNRIISIPSFLADDIRDYIQSLYVHEKDDRLLPVTKNFLENEMQRGIKLSGVKKIRIHDARHSHASLLIELGFSPKEIAERLGHENVETTLNTYSHLYPDKQERLANRLDSFYREGTTNDKENADDTLRRSKQGMEQEGELLNAAGRIPETTGMGENTGLDEERVHDLDVAGASDESLRK